MSTIRPALSDLVRRVWADAEAQSPADIIPALLNECSIDLAFYLEQALQAGYVTRIVADDRREAFRTVLPTITSPEQAAQNFAVATSSSEPFATDNSEANFVTVEPISVTTAKVVSADGDEPLSDPEPTEPTTARLPTAPGRIVSRRPVRPDTSFKRTVRLGEWDTLMAQRLAMGGGRYITMGDASADDLRAVADTRRRMASALDTEAERYDLMADIMAERGAARLRDLRPTDLPISTPKEVLS